MILKKLIGETERQFKAARLHFGHGTDNARDEAAFLVLRGLGLPFDADMNQIVDEKRVKKLVDQRIEKRIPAAYLLRESWLDGVPFYVDERVIVPRSHIAFLFRKFGSPGRVLDLCTGSGCLAVLAARAYPRAKVTASDVSAPALAVARRNIAKHKLGRRIRLVRADLFDGIGNGFDLIVSNPPYVDARAMKALPKEHRREPGLALAAGRDGLDAVRRILAEARNHLAPGGRLLCEVGDSRRALERACPKLRFQWPHASVFALKREEMG